MIKMFDRNGFMNWLEETFITNSFGRNIVSEIIEYAYEHQNVSLDQFAYFVSDLLPEVEFLEVARFCSDDMLTDTTLVLLDRKDGWLIMRLHLYYRDKGWENRGACANNYNLLVNTERKEYKIYVSPFYGYERSSDIEVKRKSDILNYIEYLKENGFVDAVEIYCG